MGDPRLTPARDTDQRAMQAIRAQVVLFRRRPRVAVVDSAAVLPAVVGGRPRWARPIVAVADGRVPAGWWVWFDLGGVSCG